MKKPKIVEVFTDNGSHSHWTLIEIETGKKLWSESPKECKAMGYPVEKRNKKHDHVRDLRNIIGLNFPYVKH